MSKKFLDFINILVFSIRDLIKINDLYNSLGIITLTSHLTSYLLRRDSLHGKGLRVNMEVEKDGVISYVHPNGRSHYNNVPIWT